MNILLTKRQKEIISKLRVSDAGANAIAFDNLESRQISMENIEILCSLINAELMMEGIFPNFEPNKYGIELENLLDVINRPRIGS
ncbi:hypothetical protein [Actimicrobium sp. CCI2.3]|uniref:hypothetical protein n=1 Tax=Actimicrobium sp. CCI2.3 TaxID=3048616 RepID=UPI002AB4CC8E|nr:hypothetical protein [Actimicrobium sp. CCI2.3]MDY7575173.1 hypothetical protein [Actimicrobium sp. CCI2.3]MEB0022364.1 hypothetical protein [Actimicrobium sp. CCI2.3]